MISDFVQRRRFLIELQDFRDFFNWKLARGEKENWKKIHPDASPPFSEEHSSQHCS